MDEEPWWNKWPDWLDESTTYPVCGKCATERGWFLLHCHDIKLNCFICENKTTNNRIAQYQIDHIRSSKELSDKH